MMPKLYKIQKFGASTGKPAAQSQVESSEELSPPQYLDEISSAFIHPTDFEGQKTPAIERMKKFLTTQPDHN